jgi:hypothetical protein
MKFKKQISCYESRDIRVAANSEQELEIEMDAVAPDQGITEAWNIDLQP